MRKKHYAEILKQHVKTSARSLDIMFKSNCMMTQIILLITFFEYLSQKITKAENKCESKDSFQPGYSGSVWTKGPKFQQIIERSLWKET